MIPNEFEKYLDEIVMSANLYWSELPKSSDEDRVRANIRPEVKAIVEKAVSDLLDEIEVANCMGGISKILRQYGR